MRHHILKIGSATAAAALAVVATACSTPTVSGTPTPQSSSTSGDGKLPGGAPHVANPLDTSHAQASPCSVLTAAQISSLGIAATGKPSDSATGPACNWGDTSTTPSKMDFGVGFVTKSKGGLSSLYVQADSLKKNGGYFEPIDPIQGYPAVLYAQFDDRKDPTRAGCNLAVGVSDTLQFTVGIDITVTPQQSDSCAIDKKITDMMMTTLRAGS